MTKWDDARLLDQICYDLVLGDWPRARNRVKIADLANGVPPYSDQEVADNKININVNDLSLTRSLQEARGQFNNAFLKPGNFFTCKTDMGPVHKRQMYGTIVTKEINRMMKKSIPYYEAMRNKFSLLSLHGISPAVWENEYRWRPRALGVEDVLIPAGTYLGFENLPFFVLRRSFTAIELQTIANKEKRDPGWNEPLLKACLKWCDDQVSKLLNNNWPDTWAPEKWHERMKEGGFYASDQVPTIDCFDFYAYDDSEGEGGWIRRIILDSWGTPTSNGVSYAMSRDSAKVDIKPSKKGDFLFSSRKRKVAESWQNVISFQFADLSPVAPNRYHSVRSLGFLLYAVCEIQNRLHCKFNEAVFESLMMLFRVKTMDDVQRALKLDMFNQGFIDDSLTPVPAQDRWQPPVNLIELGLQLNQGQIQSSTGAYAQRRDFSQDRTEKTRFQVMAELSADTALVSAAILQAYNYQNHENREIFRRFCIANNRDVEVNKAKANIFRQGVPKNILTPEAWDVEQERVIGGGNKQMERAIAQQLMEWRPLMDPEPQRIVLRQGILSVSDDPSLALELVPEQPLRVTDSTHDAQLATTTLMAGLPVDIKTGMNHIEYVETMLKNLELIVNKTLKLKRGMAKPEEIEGMQNLGKHIADHIKIIAQDEREKDRVKRYGDILGKLMNEVKGFQQRLMQAMQKAAAQNGNGQMDPKDKAKIQAMQMQAQVKAQNARESHAEKTAQRRISFEQKTQQDQQKHALEIRTQAARDALEIQSTRLKALAAEKEEPE